jgi:hypothetical protein
MFLLAEVAPAADPDVEPDVDPDVEPGVDPDVVGSPFDTTPTGAPAAAAEGGLVGPRLVRYPNSIATAATVVRKNSVIRRTISS